MKKEHAVNKTIKSIQNYLLIGLPFVIVSMIWSSTLSEKAILNNASIFTKILWEVLSWNLMLWFLVLVIFLFMLVLVPSARESTLQRLANLKERDEREQFITGRASRTAYISTLSLMILFLFLSIFTINVHRVPVSEAINGKTGTVSIGINFDLLDDATKAAPSSEVLFESKDIPFSKSAIILIFIVWQLISFNVTARKESLT